VGGTSWLIMVIVESILVKTCEGSLSLSRALWLGNVGAIYAVYGVDGHCTEKKSKSVANLLETPVLACHTSTLIGPEARSKNTKMLKRDPFLPYTPFVRPGLLINSLKQWSWVSGPSAPSMSRAFYLFKDLWNCVLLCTWMRNLSTLFVRPGFQRGLLEVVGRELLVWAPARG